MPDDLYWDDILIWSEQQADLLRRAATGERVNGLDWPNLIEEVESVGRSELHACESCLVQAIRHVLKCACWPDDRAVAHWRGELGTFLFQAERAYAPSMRQRLDLPALYTRAAAIAGQEMVSAEPAYALPVACPYALDDLVTAMPDIDALILRLRSRPGAHRA